MQSITLHLAVLAVSLFAMQAANAESFDWAGTYAGISLGARQVESDWTTTSYQDPDGIPIPFVTDPNASLDSTDFFVNGFAGYNWIVAPRTILGVEGNMGYANIDDTHTTIPGVFDAPPDFSFIEAETTWAGSLRGRAGYLITPSVHL